MENPEKLQGRPRATKLDPLIEAEMVAAYKNRGRVKVESIAHQFGVTRRTLYNALRRCPTS